MAFYTEVSKFSNLYRYQQNIGTGYGHKVDEAQTYEYVRWDGCIVRDGVRGGGDGAIYRRWNQHSACSDEFIQEAMSLQRWHELKRIYKLNNNDTAKERGHDEYNPCCKYDLVYKVLVHNTIAITKQGELDLTGDETTWAHQGYGEKGAKNLWRVAGKPGVSKGGQTVVISATNRIRPYWYQHRHKFNKRYPEKNIKAEGPSEVITAINELEHHIEGRDGDAKKIFKSPFHLTFDNFFSQEEVFHHAGSKGVGLLATLRRDRLCQGVQNFYLHKEKTQSNPRSKAARFIQPVIAVKTEDEYDIVHTSFQSTSSCNICSVNSFESTENFVQSRSRGRVKDENKRYYVIEQNFARLLYLSGYSRIDSIDHLIKVCKMKYRSWKYWHSPATHGKAFGLCVAYDSYLEVAEGDLDITLKVPNPVDFHTFRDILSEQQCLYDPRNQQYPGDDKLRVVTQMNNSKRKKLSQNTSLGDTTGIVSKQQYIQAKCSKRFCYDLTSFANHHLSVYTSKHGKKCAVCGEQTFKHCGICKVALHQDCRRGPGVGKNCFMEYHDPNYYGLCFADRNDVGKTAKTWKAWTHNSFCENRRRIKSFQK